MKTLYDLLGALPEDNADDLRAAFRKAVKANHPDLNPDDPEASQTFRRIVRANAILSDERQRAAYDRLLEVARRQQDRKPKRGVFSAGIRRLGVDVMASVVASVVIIGGYLLLRPGDRLPLAPASLAEMSRHEPAQAATAGSTGLSSQEQARPAEKAEHAGADIRLDASPPDLNEPVRPDSSAPLVVTTGRAPASAEVSPAEEPGPKDVKYYRERGISAYRSGDLYIALANFDLAIRLDPACSDCYVDRGIVLRRMGDQKGAISDVAAAKRIDDVNQAQARRAGQGATR